MVDLLKINQDAMKVVQLSEMALGKANEWELDTITYEIRDKDGAIVAEYVGRENQEAAQADADNRNFAEDVGAPFHVTQRSNLSVNQQGKLDFEVGSAIGIQFPFEAIDAAAEQLNNAIDCEAIEEMIKDEVKRVKEILEAKIKKTGELSPYGDLLSLPSNPLKILSWAKKFVSMYLGPQVLAMIDLAMQIALTAQAITNITQAANAAQQNLRLCAISAVDTLLEESIGAATDLIDTALPGLDDTLIQINDVQNKISDITGNPPIFDVANGIDGLVESATAENKAKFMTEVNNFAMQAYDSPETLATEAAELDTAADELNEALGLPPRGSAVPGVVEVVIDGATFTFQNGVMVQAVGTNSGSGTGIATNSQTSTATMSGFVGTEWDGSIPSHVELVGDLERYGYGPGGIGITHGDVGPYGTPSFLQFPTLKWYIPNDLKVVSAKFNIRNDRVFGRGSIGFVPGSGQNNLWTEAQFAVTPVMFLYWLSATPGGTPLTNSYGTAIVKGGEVEGSIRFIQAYDLSLLKDDAQGQIGVTGGERSGDVSLREFKPVYATTADDTNSVLLPVATKTFFFNTALVSSTDGTTYLANGTVPTSASDLAQWVPDQTKFSNNEDYRYYVNNSSQQLRVVQGNMSGKPHHTLTEYLRETFIRKDGSNVIYNGTDSTMESFIGSTFGGSYPSTTQLITGWTYTDGTSVGTSTDIGFTSDTPINSTARKYPIPTNGKVSTSEFSVGWGGAQGADSDFNYTYYYDRNNSKFDITFSPPSDTLSRAWYDLDLMPIAWISDEPGGSPKTLVDGSTGKVVKLEKTGATYKAQQLLSTTKSLGTDRATLPIVQKTFFFNVAVVSSATATSLVASGSAPSSAQCVSWSVSDPALGYTGSNDQHLKIKLSSRSTDRSDKKIPKT